MSPNGNKGDVPSILVVVHDYATMPIRASKWHQKYQCQQKFVKLFMKVYGYLWRELL